MKKFLTALGGWIAILNLFNSILVILGRWEEDNEMLCALEKICLQLERFLHPTGIKII